MDAPSVYDLLSNQIVQLALGNAWHDSLANLPNKRHEEGGWIYCHMEAMTIEVRRADSGGQSLLDLSFPPELEGFVVVATFHTHPNPTSEGWNPGPSVDDTESAIILGVPCIIRSDAGDSYNRTGFPARRSNWTGGLS